MTGRVFRLHSTLELPLEDVETYFEEDPDLPPEIDDIDITRRNNTLIIKALSDDESISKYTPTAQLKASVTGDACVGGRAPRAPPAVDGRRGRGSLRARRVRLLQGRPRDRPSKLRAPVPDVPRVTQDCDPSEKGTLTAITEEDGELEATRIVEGEPRPASIEVVESPQGAGDGDGGVNWRDNEFISD